MKRLLGILLAVCMMMTLVSAFADDAVVIYESKFAAGDDGWKGRGAISYHTTEATLRTENRSSDWNSPGREFELVAGTKYDVSVEVYQDEADDEPEFIISVAHSNLDGETYERLVFGTVKKGEWTTIAGSFTLGEFDSYVLYIETNDQGGGHPTLSYEIRNFKLTAPDGIAAPKATEAPADAAEATPVPGLKEIPSLKEVYADYFDFGAAVPQYAFGVGQDQLKILMVSQFSILTPENELKPDSVLDVQKSQKLAKDDETAVAIKLTAATPLLEFAQKYGLKVHGHVLLWHSQTPEAFFHEGYDTMKPYVTREVMLGRMENYIREVLTQTDEKFPGVIVSWDVVNEAIDDGTNWLRKGSNWYKVVGDDFLNRAFEYARKYAAEGVLLYYNDYSTANPAKLRGILKLLNQLIPEGNIDGYGFQMHHDLGWPSIGQMTEAVEKIAALGLKLRVSELDIGVSKNNEANMDKQAKRYKEMLNLMLKFADQTEAVQVWGLTDNMSWRTGKYPLLFDSKVQPKKAFFAVIEAAEEFGAQ